MNTNYRVIFATRAPKKEQPGTIVIIPNEDNWNDFGFQIRVDIIVFLYENLFHNSEKLFLEGFLSFIISKKSELFDIRLLHERLQNSEEKRLNSLELPVFFTMLPDIAAYREIVGKIGPDDARVVLHSLHDVVEADNGVGDRSWLRAATDSLVFRRAFLRTAESFFAWKNAGSVLDGVSFEQIGRISNELRICFQLAGRPNEHQLKFQFDFHETILPKRFSVVIGKNGVGKSQTLNRIADAAMRGLPILTDGKGDRPSFNRILAFYPTAIASDAFPPPKRRRSKVWYRRFSLGGPGFGRRRQTTADIIVELARTTEMIGGRSRFDIFLKAIRSIEGHEELALLTRDFDEKSVSVTRLRYGGERDQLDRFASIDPNLEIIRLIDGKHFDLSSGELSFIRFAATTSLNIENSSLLLFDEPETHLHPNFISQFVAVLDNLLEQTGSAAIIATHSVYFVREAFEDQVQVLRSGSGRKIIVETPVLKTFGADVGAISYFVFGEDEPSRLAKTVQREIAEKADSWERVFEIYKNNLSLDLLSEIRAKIEDRNRTGPTT